MSCCSAQPRGRGGLSSWGGMAVVPECHALPLDTGMPEMLLLPCASLKLGRNPPPGLAFPLSKASQHPQLPFRAAQTGVPALLHCRLLTRATYRQGINLLTPSQNVSPSQSLQVCAQGWGCGWQLHRPWGNAGQPCPGRFCTSFLQLDNGANKGLKPPLPPPQQQLFEGATLDLRKSI